jgi:hypothetical protein
MTTNRTSRLPNGAALAAIVAAGIGSAVLGLMTAGAEASTALHDALNLNAGVGPLSGKTLVAVAAYLISWVALHFMWRGRDLDFGRTMRIAYVLIALGFLLTFPPIFTLFASE